MENNIAVSQSILKVKKKISILIVDDRPENLLTLESILEREERIIIKASGGNDALRIAIKEDIGLILLDIQMPDMDGTEVAALLRSNSRTRHIPIIFVSAVTKSERPSMEEFEEGTIDCLFKPLNLEETQSKVAVFEKLYHLQVEKNELTVNAEKLSKKLEQFVYIISHDLKAPLRAIDNLSSWIADDLSSSTEINTVENLILLKSRVGRMSALLEGVLEYSRCGRIMELPEEIDLNKMVQMIFETIAHPSGFLMEVKHLPMVVGQPTRIYKILYNIINNSIIHHDNPSSGKIFIECNSNSIQHTIRITDNGPGIKIQYADKIFNLFSTLKARDEKETTGAGLAIVTKLLEDIYQKIEVLTGNGEGVTFSFTLPV